MTLCFDTSILIWGVREEATSGQEHMIERTKKYIAYLDDNDQRVMIPAPVLAEYLVGSKSPAERGAERQVIERRFRVPSLDAPSAQLAAELQDADNIRIILAGNKDLDRYRLRIDALIVAIAIIHGAERIISNDPHLKTLAGGKIEVTPVPEISVQGEFEGFA
jgi:predicted nucleic acid-binding protein